MRTIIVEGPPACGKTRNAREIARHFRCRTTIEGDDHHVSRAAWNRLIGPVLVLTTNAAALPSFMREYATLHRFDRLPSNCRHVRAGGLA